LSGSSFRAFACAAAVVAAGAGASGCSTKRVLTIRSDPPGARVWVGGVERGRTPVDVPFVHYGRFPVRLEKEGHESLAGEVEVPTQIDGYPVIDLPHELTVRERRFEWTGRLRPVAAKPTEADARAALERAKAMRAATRRAVTEAAAPAPSRPPGPPPVVR
jgi:hypothetical protein